MAKGQFKFTVAELTEMVDRFLEAADASLASAAETGNTAQVIPATRAAFVRYWRRHGDQLQRTLTKSSVDTWMSEAEEHPTYKLYADQIARIDEAGAAYYERLALINPKLQQLAQLGLRQACYGGYKDKPDTNVLVSVANKGAKIDWGK